MEAYILIVLANSAERSQLSVWIATSISSMISNPTKAISAWRKPCKSAPVTYCAYHLPPDSSNARRSRPRWAEVTAAQSVVAHEREHSVAQKANAAEREHYAHSKLNQWVNPLLD
jgi:ethanolamine utilization microcompartment shell protein EutL